MPASRMMALKVFRSQQARFLVNERRRLDLIPGMIAARDDIDARLKQFIADLAVDAEAMRRVLTIGDHEIQRQLLAQSRHVAGDDSAPRPPDDVAEKQNLHAALPPGIG